MYTDRKKMVSKNLDFFLEQFNTGNQRNLLLFIKFAIQKPMFDAFRPTFFYQRKLYGVQCIPKVLL